MSDGGVAMNRILFEKGEIGEDGIVTVEDFRAEYILNVLLMF